MKILFLSRWFPYPADNGSKIRIFNLIRQLSRQHSLDLISFCSEPVSAERFEGLRPYCGTIAAALYHPFEPDRWEAIRGFFSTWPRSMVATHSAELEQEVARAVSSRRYDLVIASQIDMVPYALDIPVPLKVFEEIELTTQYEQVTGQKNPVKRMRSALTWRKLAQFLKRTMPQFDGITVVSEQERRRICEVIPGFEKITVIPNGVDLSYLSGDFGEPEPDTLIYNGALTYSANFDAMMYFLKEVFPLIRQQRPGACIYITGKTDGVRLQDLPAGDGVVYTGYLPDIRPRVARSWVSVVPLRLGGGTRLKVLESMALGTPVVSTTKGAEGLEVHPGEDILIADNPVGFASAVLRLFYDPVLRRNMGAAGRENVSRNYSWDTIGSRFNGFLDQVVGGNHHGGH